MDSETRELLEETLELSKENNKILKKMRNASRWGTAFRVVYWTIILGSMVGAYYFFQPFIDSLVASYEEVLGLFGGGGNSVVNSIPNISDLLNPPR